MILIITYLHSILMTKNNVGVTVSLVIVLFFALSIAGIIGFNLLIRIIANKAAKIREGETK